MRALVKSRPETGIWMVKDAPAPEVGVHDVMIRIRKTAICGTDVHIYNWDEWSRRTIPVPMIVGHEYSGVVERVGAEVEAFRPEAIPWPEIAFKTTRWALHDWIRRRRPDLHPASRLWEG